MAKIKFEYKITLIYLFVGCMWILFSDKAVELITLNDTQLILKLQTFKGWFYVIVTALLFFVFTQKHLRLQRNIEKELKNHKENLQELVCAKTLDLEKLNEQLQQSNLELTQKSDFINEQNEELKETLQSLQDTQLRLIQADKMASLGTLTAGVAHEINNPLNFIQGAYYGLQNYFDKYGSSDKSKTDFLLFSIKQGVDKTSNIVNCLNEFSNNKGTDNEDCNLHTIIDNCLLMLSDKTINKIAIHKKFTSQNVTIKGNTGKLHQAFINILTNSVQAIKDNGTIEILTDIIDNNIFVQITDNGCGINNDILNKIAEPFFTTKEPGEGTGLGLYITYSIIKDHNGSIEFDSKLGKWTKVSIRFSKI